MKAVASGELRPMQTTTGQKHKTVGNGGGNLKTNNKPEKKRRAFQACVHNW
jgi:hypothetical protein